MTRSILPVFFTLFIMAPFCWAKENELQLQDSADRYSYSLGHQVGNDFKKQGISLDRDAFAKGIKDGLGSDVIPAIPQEEMNTLLSGLKNKIIASQEKDRQQALEQFRSESHNFLAENAKKEAVVTLPSGLQYQIIAPGTGKTPALTDSVKVKYRGTTVDGQEFTNSEKDYAPTSFKVDTLVKGLQEALLLMQEGAKWQLFIPADLAYGESGPLAERAVIYELELVAIE